MNWVKARDYEEMSTLAARRMFELISAKVSQGEPVNLGMATGNTMIGTYRMLAELLNGTKIDLSRVSTFNLDEYVDDKGENVSPEHPLSYRKYMYEKLAALLAPRLGFKRERMHFPDATNPGNYDAQIENSGGLEFQLLGIGFNGHIAFNEPQSEDEISAEDFAALPSRVISLDALTIQTNSRLTAGGNSDLVPRKAVTMGMRSILKAKEILLLACFPEQVAPLTRIRTSRITPELQASFLLEHPSAHVIYTGDNIKL